MELHAACHEEHVSIRSLTPGSKSMALKLCNCTIKQKHLYKILQLFFSRVTCMAVRFIAF